MKKTGLKIAGLIIFDIATIILSMIIASLLLSNNIKPIDYSYYISYYALGLVFLNIGMYLILGIYTIDLFKITLKDLARIGIASGVVFICNIIFILIAGWFSVLWALFYCVMEFLFTCSLRFIFTISRLNANKEKEVEK